MESEAESAHTPFLKLKPGDKPSFSSVFLLDKPTSYAQIRCTRNKSLENDSTCMAKAKNYRSQAQALLLWRIQLPATVMRPSACRKAGFRLQIFICCWTVFRFDVYIGGENTFINQRVMVEKVIRLSCKVLPVAGSWKDAKRAQNEVTHKCLLVRKNLQTFLSGSLQILFFFQIVAWLEKSEDYITS